MQNSNIDLISGINTLGDKIRKLRQSKGWSQRELACKVNLSPAGIHKIESNKNLQTRKIVALAKVFNVDPSALDTYDSDHNNKIHNLKLLKEAFPNWKELIIQELRNS